MLLNDNNFLYIGVIVGGIHDSLIVNCTERDDAIFEDDNFGFLISSDNYIFHQFYINSAGTIWDLKTDFKQGTNDLKWDGKFDIATKSNENSWIAEIKIPLSELNIDENVSELKFNFCICRQFDEELAYFLPEWSYSSIKNGIMTIKKK